VGGACPVRELAPSLLPTPLFPALPQTHRAKTFAEKHEAVLVGKLGPEKVGALRRWLQVGLAVPGGAVQWRAGGGR
jgi:hypothetical protein